MADALSQKSTGSLHYVRATKMPMLIELRRLNVELNMNAPDCILATLKVRPLLMERIAQAQQTDEEVLRWTEDIKSGKTKIYFVMNKESLRWERESTCRIKKT